jgi:carbonic anhydrase/acetyltransferase-like protein (isoleucine patch superfamily)
MALIRAFRDAVPRLGRDVFVAESASVIGAVDLADEVSVWYGAVLRGDVGSIRIGARTNIQDNATIHMTHQVSDSVIGADVIIGHNAVIHGATIEDGALLGMHAVILDNARLGAGAWVAAGSVVPPKMLVPPNTLVRGNPAKIVREVRPEEHAWAREGVLRYLELAKEHRRQQLAAGVTYGVR